MARAGQVPPLAEGAIPLSILVDFDGTVAATDVGDTVLARHAIVPEWRDRDDAYVSGRTGSRTLVAWNVTILEQDRAVLEATAAAQPADLTFPPFAREMLALGAEVEVVSDGLGFYVEPFLAAMGSPDLPVATSTVDFGTRPFRVTFPYGHPRCFVCGTCKRERVLAHRATGRFVAFVGDGASDRYAAWHADLVFAKHRLADLCDAEGWPYVRWERFADVGARLEEGLADGSLPLAALEERQPRGEDGGFICGPEVWGAWRVDPGPVVRRQRREEGGAS